VPATRVDIVTGGNPNFVILAKQNPESVKKAACIIAQMAKNDESTAQNTLTDIAKSDADLARDLENAMYDFQDLAVISNQDFQRLLRELDRGVLVRALRLTHKKIQTKILTNLSKRVAQEVIEDCQARGKIPYSKIMAAQKEIVRIALKLESQGQINFTSAMKDAEA